MTITRRVLGIGSFAALLAMIVFALGIGPGANRASGAKRP